MCDACKDWGQPMPEYIKSPGGLRLLFHALPTAKEMHITDGGMKSADSGKKSGKKTAEGGKKGGKKNIKGGPETEAGGPEIIARAEQFNVTYGLIEGTTLAKTYVLLKTNPSMTTRELSAVLNISRSAILKHINSLKERGFIRRIGATKNGYWECLANEEGGPEGGPEIKESGPECGPEMERGSQKSSQKTNIGSQKTDDGGQKTNGGGQKSGQKGGDYE